MPSPKKNAASKTQTAPQAAAPAPVVAAPVPAPVAAPAPKGKKAAAAQAAPAPAATPVTAAEAPPKPKSLITPNQRKTLGLLCALPNTSDGLTRKEIQEKAELKTTGYPALMKLEFVEEHKVEGQRGVRYRATEAGRNWLKMNKE